MRRTLAVAAILVNLAACGGQEAPAAEPVDATSSQPADRVSEAKDDAINAYQRFWESVAEAGAIPDAEHPNLSQYATGDALDKVTRMILGYEAVGHYSEGTPVTNPTVTEVNPSDKPTEVSIADCIDTRDYLVYDQETREPTNDVPGGFREVQAIVEYLDGAWLVSAFGAGKVGSCEERDT